MKDASYSLLAPLAPFASDAFPVSLTELLVAGSGWLVHFFVLHVWFSLITLVGLRRPRTRPRSTRAELPRQPPGPR